MTPLRRMRRHLGFIACLGAFAAPFLALVLLVRLSPGAHSIDRAAQALPAVVSACCAAGNLVHSVKLLPVAVFVGSPAAVAVMAGSLAGLSLVWRDKVGALLAVAGPVLAGAVTEFVAKPAIGRRGPTGSLLFPSGHAAGVTAVAIVSLVLLHRRFGLSAVVACVPIAALAVLLVGAGLVTRGYHYVTDVAGGVALAGALVIGLNGLVSLGERRVTRRRMEERVLP